MGQIAVLECNLKLDNIWKLKCYFSMPIGTDQLVDYYTIAIQIGRYF